MNIAGPAPTGTQMSNLLSEITGQEDIDPAETQEWIEALQSVLEIEGSERAHFLIEKLVSVT
jgi:pyruvate dehydrogenase E1 component